MQILDVMELRPFNNVLVDTLAQAGVTLAITHCRHEWHLL